MQPKLRLEPPNNSYYYILKKFNESIPLSCEELNFLRRYHSKLSDPVFDRIFNYYHLLENHSTFVFPKGNLTLQNSKQFKNRLAFTLQNGVTSIQVEMTPEQLFQLKMLFGHEIMFFPGQLQLAGSWYFPEGFSHLEFFKWGKLFGVIEYQTNSKKKIVAHFENMGNRKLEQCIDQFQQKGIKTVPKPLLSTDLQYAKNTLNIVLQTPNPRINPFNRH